MLFLGAWGNMIHEKTWSKQSRDSVPLKYMKKGFLIYEKMRRYLVILYMKKPVHTVQPVPSK